MKKILLFLGFLVFYPSAFAAVHSVENISEKVKGDRLSLSDVNSILGTIRGFFFDDSTGFVGIGTDSPAADLHVGGDSFVLGNTNDYNMTFINIPASEGGLTRSEIYFRGENGDTDWSIRNMNNSFDIINSQNVANGSNFSINQEGNVGIGTTSPDAKLTVDINSNADGYEAQRWNSNVSGLDNGSHALYGSTGDWYIRSASSDGKVILQDTGGNVGIGTTSPDRKLVVKDDDGTPIQIEYDGTLGNGSSVGIAFLDNGDGSSAVNSQIRAIRESDYESGLAFFTKNSTTGTQESLRVYGNGNAWLRGTLAEASDSRHKKEIQTLSSALEKVSALRGVSYQWKDLNDDSTKIGVVAQEIEKVYPELVHTSESGYKSVSYSKLVAPLIEAVKEIFSITESNADRIAGLEAQIEALRLELDK